MTPRPLAPEADLAHVLDLAKIALRTGTMIDPEDLLCDLLNLDEQQLQDYLERDAAYPDPGQQQAITYTPAEPQPRSTCGRCGEAITWGPRTLQRWEWQHADHDHDTHEVDPTPDDQDIVNAYRAAHKPEDQLLPVRTLTTEPGTPERINELSRWADADNGQGRAPDLVDRMGHTEAATPHIRHMDDGAAYCGYATPTGIYEGCGQSWPCETIRKRQSAAPDQSGPAPRAREWRVAEAGTVAHRLELGRPVCGTRDVGPWRSVVGVDRCSVCVVADRVLVLRHG